MSAAQHVRGDRASTRESRGTRHRPVVVARTVDRADERPQPRQPARCDSLSGTGVRQDVATKSGAVRGFHVSGNAPAAHAPRGQHTRAGTVHQRVRLAEVTWSQLKKTSPSLHYAEVRWRSRGRQDRFSDHEALACDRQGRGSRKSCCIGSSCKTYTSRTSARRAARDRHP